MKKSFKTFLITIASSLALVMPAVAMPITAYALTATEDLQNKVCTGGELTFDNRNCKGTTADAQSDVNSIVTMIVNIFSIVVGIISVIFIIIGGVKYVTSGGEANNITAAKNTIMYAIIGLIVVALAQILVRFVLGRVTGDITG